MVSGIARVAVALVLVAGCVAPSQEAPGTPEAEDGADRVGHAGPETAGDPGDGEATGTTPGANDTATTTGEAETNTTAGVEASAYAKWNSTQAIEAFLAAGLEAERPYKMGPRDYGLAPYRGEGTRFIVPSLCAEDETEEPCDKGGRVLSFDNAEDQEAVRDYYVELGERSAVFFSWVFEKDNLVLQLNGDLEEEKAYAYNATLQSMG